MIDDAHIIGNGSSAWLYDKNSTGLKLTCNLPPFNVPDVYATVIVDFKMMKAITDESIIVGGNWILGARPKLWMQKYPTVNIKHAHQIREYYTVLPKYVPNYTDLSCGHMAVHYVANRHRPKTIHMYGFDSIFDFDLRSSSDFYMISDRTHGITAKLTNNWRRIWPYMFSEFSRINFKLYTSNNTPKINLPDNVEVIVRSKH